MNISTFSDLHYFCQSFYKATYIPIIHLAHPAEFISSFPRYNKDLASTATFRNKISFSEEKHYYISDSFAFFGYIPLKNTQEYLVIGPIFSTHFTTNHIENFVKEFRLRDVEAVTHLLQSTPILSLNQCLNLVAFLEFLLNHEQTDSLSQLNVSTDIKQNFHRQLSLQLYEQREEEFFHNSYFFEKSLHHALSIGSRPQLEKILSEAGQIKNGPMADNSLRQQKNTFIASVTLATRAAIEGGLTIEHAYSLSDLYIQECERLTKLEEVLALSHTMYLDFTDRVAQLKYMSQQSIEIFQAIQYIQNHLNTAIQVEDVANEIGYSYSYLKKRFKEETGMTISQFILKEKIETAKDLLSYSNYSISYISNYLAFSTQSYFQNQFKKITGETPFNYRKNNRVI
ncbi:TPA: helix-turn-helix domain-containing protein [Streptococcus suis]